MKNLKVQDKCNIEIFLSPGDGQMEGQRSLKQYAPSTSKVRSNTLINRLFNP